MGLGLALGAGSALDLVEVILGIVMLAALLVLVWAERSRLLPHLARAVRLSRKATGYWPVTPAGSSSTVNTVSSPVT